MAEPFHGVFVQAREEPVRPLTMASSSVIGLIGTAPDADDSAFPLDTPVLVTGNRTAAARLDTAGDGAGTLPAAIDGIFDQIGAAVVVVRVAEGADGPDGAETRANVIGGLDDADGYRGAHAFLAAEARLGVKPRVLCAPGFTHQRGAPGEGSDPEGPGSPGTANPVVAELAGLAARLRAVVVADAPSTTDAEALAYAGDWGDERVFAVEPQVLVSRDGEVVAEPASARVAGLIARVDQQLGWWHSPSNKTLAGVVGTARAIDLAPGDPNARALHLNRAGLAAIVRRDGFRLWGNRTLSGDQPGAFLSVVRSRDAIEETLATGFLDQLDRPLTQGLIDELVESVAAFLRGLEAQGAIRGFAVFANPELNTPQSLSTGRLYLDVSFDAVEPAETITFRTALTNRFTEIEA
ncbi:hypothetical protein EV659_1166 [Rhodothalassium salexigens DSM 2132]|uniref:Tail sheath protein subtilisin-like domain-containing protein n=1 Tax=Rhodothalassium salexigens DSM 2132 TaxID=1188247 RepID=A0A4R2P7S3_RHOSA|nr:phage tail sheath subtilisin-like domain-containing protein [Rhodothalassium salexigens]MBB4212767.1 hypothetical protein [Rhodothalassium salexigens DSM 2132]MBK1638970.1 phage tail protein [Rhodothalassium salexigens DSM 2132]TCP30041.1 hypothetical protein EV659_1166 [Rhodothalassium salexigens DSM 2132]